jgi:hypothetical protein
MKKLLATMLFAAVSAVALAQSTTGGTATWSWGAVTQFTDGSTIPSTDAVTYNVYTGTNGPGSESATPTLKGVSTLTGTTSGYTAGQTVYGYVTAVVNGVEGGHSNEASKSFPAIPGTTTCTVR